MFWSFNIEICPVQASTQSLTKHMMVMELNIPNQCFNFNYIISIYYKLQCSNAYMHLQLLEI